MMKGAPAENVSIFIVLPKTDYPLAAHLQIAARLLLPFDGFKERLEVALAEAAASFALNDFKEYRWAVFDWACEDLQHVSLFVTVHQNAEFFQLVDGLI